MIGPHTLANSCVILGENSVGGGVCERTRGREDYLVCPRTWKGFPGKVRQKDFVILYVAPVCVNLSVHTWLWGSLLFGITLLTKLAEGLGRKAVGLSANFWAVATPVPIVYPIPSSGKTQWGCLWTDSRTWGLPCVPSHLKGVPRKRSDCWKFISAHCSFISFQRSRACLGRWLQQSDAAAPSGQVFQACALIETNFIDHFSVRDLTNL